MSKGRSYLISCTSPTIFFCSIFLLLFFSNMKCKRRIIKFIQFFAPVSFGVYLFHEEPLIKEVFMNNAFVSYVSLNPFIMALAIIATSLCIWFVGSLVDRGRLLMFDLLKVRNFCTWIESNLRNGLTRLCRK